MISIIKDFIVGLLENLSMKQNTSLIISEIVLLILYVLFLWILDFVIRKFVYKLIRVSVKKTKTEWDDILLETLFFKRVIHVIPAIILRALVEPSFEAISSINIFVISLVDIYIIIMLTLATTAVVRAGNVIYERKHKSTGKSLKTYSQVLQIFIIAIAVILIISVTFSEKPGQLIGGLGAFTAILMLVFRDPILGFVGGIQLSANNMLIIGDWISMPSNNADGTVEEITLTAVKVQNWDKTITTIPTYDLVQNSFKNWRAMEQGGGRRIMKDILINTQSIKFIDKDLYSRLEKIQLLKDYLSKKEKEIEEHNNKNKVDVSSMVNGRRQTNIGAFRAYLTEYLKNNPNVNQDLILMTRQLPMTDKGLPIQIYAFSKIKSWVEYEQVQADIMDHIFAIVGEFDLVVFQDPSGNDFRNILKSN